jgi:heat shock protein beta
LAFAPGAARAGTIAFTTTADWASGTQVNVSAVSNRLALLAIEQIDAGAGWYRLPWDGANYGFQAEKDDTFWFAGGDPCVLDAANPWNDTETFLVGARSYRAGPAVAGAELATLPNGSYLDLPLPAAVSGVLFLTSAARIAEASYTVTWHYDDGTSTPVGVPIPADTDAARERVGPGYSVVDWPDPVAQIGGDCAAAGGGEVAVQNPDPARPVAAVEVAYPESPEPTGWLAGPLALTVESDQEALEAMFLYRGSYASSSSAALTALDAGSAASWTLASWTAAFADNSEIALYVQCGDDVDLDGLLETGELGPEIGPISLATDVSPVALGSPCTGRYARYRLEFYSEFDPGTAPLLNDITFTFDPDSDGDGDPDSVDCNDANPAIFHGAPEVPADGVDQDCSGGDVCYVDVDVDTWGGSGTTPSQDLDCVDAGEASDSFDCDDGNASSHPGAPDVVADGVDQDCDAGDRCYLDGDGDGYGSSGFVDSIDLDCSDAGEASNPGDCDDAVRSTNPGALDLCGNGVDDDCDAVGDYATPGPGGYLDDDGDGLDYATEQALGQSDCGADSDGDGLADAQELAIGTDPADADTDDDGIDDGTEVGANPADPLDSDGDGLIDALSADPDGDGIPSVVEQATGSADPDADGTPNELDRDSDGDGHSDASEWMATADPDGDDDGDGEPDFVDLDSDDDQVADVDELGIDLDADGLRDVGSDSDGDGAPDRIDDDDDGDGLRTAAEQGTGDADPTNDDSDGDALPDSLDDDDDDDGVPTSQEGATANGAGSRDSDGDGAFDYLDADDDQDTVPSHDEDPNGNGLPADDDTDGDGRPDYRDADDDGDGLATVLELAGGMDPLDADSDDDGFGDLADGCPGFDDGDDSDADGLPDPCEPCGDADDDGQESTACGGPDCDDADAALGPFAADTCGDGVDSDCDGIGDGAGDEDGDGLTFTVESGLGTSDCLADSDADGLGDGAEVAAGSDPLAADSDGDGTGDALDTCPGFDDSDDSDADGAPDACEVCGDDDDDGQEATGCGGPDCDDGDPGIGTFAADACGDGVDADCDGIGGPAGDEDGDGVAYADELALGTSDCAADSDGDGVGDAIDGCPGLDDDGDDDGQAAVACGGGDCDDAAAAVHTGVAEVADDGIDQDCSGSDTVTCFVDGDGDGYGGTAAVLAADGDCLDSGESGSGTDCDDGSVGIHPGAVETADDGIDQDCADGDLVSPASEDSGEADPEEEHPGPRRGYLGCAVAPRASGPLFLAGIAVLRRRRRGH